MFGLGLLPSVIASGRERFQRPAVKFVYLQGLWRCHAFDHASRSIVAETSMNDGVPRESYRAPSMGVPRSNLRWHGDHLSSRLMLPLYPPQRRRHRSALSRFSSRTKTKPKAASAALGFFSSRQSHHRRSACYFCGVQRQLGPSTQVTRLRRTPRVTGRTRCCRNEGKISMLPRPANVSPGLAMPKNSNSPPS
jgi:hypothetical protein